MVATTTTITDEALLERAHDGDADALRSLIDRHLHPAWRIASIAAPRPELAEAAVVEGFCDGLQAAHRHPDATQPLRVRIVASTRRAAALTGAGEAGAAASGDPVVDAFRTLPEKWRTSFWLTEVEGGSPEQVAPVLGLDRTAAAALADRAATGLRQRLATDLATRVADDDCRKALSRLPAHAAGRLTPAEQDDVGAHVATCGSCAVWLAALVSPRPALRRLIDPPPATLAPAIAARWTELLERKRRGWLAPFTERALGAAAAAVLAIGLGGAALLGGGDGDDDGPQLVSPAAALPEAGAAVGDSALGSTSPLPLPAASTLPRGGGTTASSGRLGIVTNRSTTPTTAPRFEAPRSLGGGTTTTPGTTPQTTTPPPQNQTSPTPPPTIPPLPDGTGDDGTQVGVDIPGTATIGVGDCTGGTILDVSLGGCVPPPSEQIITVEVPGLPPIGS